MLHTETLGVYFKERERDKKKSSTHLFHCCTSTVSRWSLMTQRRAVSRRKTAVQHPQHTQDPSGLNTLQRQQTGTHNGQKTKRTYQKLLSSIRSHTAYYHYIYAAINIMHCSQWTQKIQTWPCCSSHTIILLSDPPESSCVSGPVITVSQLQKYHTHTHLHTQDDFTDTYDVVGQYLQITD